MRRLSNPEWVWILSVPTMNCQGSDLHLSPKAWKIMQFCQTMAARWYAYQKRSRDEAVWFYRDWLRAEFKFTYHQCKCAYIRVIIPMQCEYFALEAIMIIVQNHWAFEVAKPKTVYPVVLRTMFDPRNTLANDVSMELIEHFGPIYLIPSFQYSFGSLFRARYPALDYEMNSKRLTSVYSPCQWKLSSKVANSNLPNLSCLGTFC